MDVKLLKSKRISPLARSKIINDFFPDFDDTISEDDVSDSKHLPIHAGAFCLYTATLITKIYETCPESIIPETIHRENALFSLLQTSPKYANLTETQAKLKAHEMIVRDIRNCFAHGNFEISYDIYTKKLYFVLLPQRKDFDIDIPIVISKSSLKKAIKNHIFQKASPYSLYTRKEIESKASGNLNGLTKTIVLPSQMLQIAEQYLDNKSTINHAIDKTRYPLIQYALLVSQITYEQDDYYKIFGKDSNIFERISIMRNAIAHDNFGFSTHMQNVNYQDRNKSLEEPLNKNIISLQIAHQLKKTIFSMLNKGHKPESVDELTQRLKEFFDFTFCDNNALFDWTENELGDE